MKRKVILVITITLSLVTSAIAQQSYLYNHYYLNPFLNNPSFIAPSGYSELYLNYRKQWSGFEGAPTTGTLNLQIPLSYKSGFAFTAIKDQAGVLQTTTGLVSFSYAIFFGQSTQQVNTLTFGLSAGVTNSRIDATKADDPGDPVVGNATTSMDGQVGVNYRNNRFKLAFGIPRIFDTRVVSQENFTKPGITQLRNTISSISYDFRLSPRLSVEPMATYRTFQNLDPIIEGLTTLRFGEVGWVGAGYRQTYGAFSYFGLNIMQKLKVAYSYEFALNKSERIPNATHEVQISFRLGKRQHSRVAKPLSRKPVVTPKAVAVQDTVKSTPKADQTTNEPIPAAPGNTNQSQETTSPAQVAPVTKPAAKPSESFIAPGHYVVVGVFNVRQNAMDYVKAIKKAGYPAKVFFDPTRVRYIVHMEEPASSIEDARKVRDKYRAMSRYWFRDSWVLSVE